MVLHVRNGGATRRACGGANSPGILRTTSTCRSPDMVSPASARRRTASHHRDGVRARLKRPARRLRLPRVCRSTGRSSRRCPHACHIPTAGRVRRLRDARRPRGARSEGPSARPHDSESLLARLDGRGACARADRARATRGINPDRAAAAVTDGGGRRRRGRPGLGVARGRARRRKAHCSPRASGERPRGDLHDRRRPHGRSRGRADRRGSGDPRRPRTTGDAAARPRRQRARPNRPDRPIEKPPGDVALAWISSMTHGKEA